MKLFKPTDIGQYGEDIAAKFLVDRGYEIINRNWRTRFCEIDIIAKKKNVIYFVEVKYRKSSAHGHGFDYITPKKQQQMRFAAETWMHTNDWQADCCLSAMSITEGKVEFIDSI